MRIKFLKLEEKLKKSRKYYKDHSLKAFLTSKISRGLSSFFIIAAGMSKMTYKKFIEYIISMDF